MSPSSCPSPLTAHPRSRGENSETLATVRQASGSSPLTRGKPTSQISREHTWGLIPAHAGKTPPTRRPTSPPGAHPRSRGENAREELVTEASDGSSPLTRGKPENGFSLGTAWRLIPAHAGKTPGSPPGGVDSRAHPRSRGENLRLYGLGALREGSSPLTRGKRIPKRVSSDGAGLIPAHAGKTWDQMPPEARSAAHPRSRGENWR